MASLIRQKIQENNLIKPPKTKRKSEKYGENWPKVEVSNFSIIAQTSIKKNIFLILSKIKETAITFFLKLLVLRFLGFKNANFCSD